MKAPEFPAQLEWLNTDRRFSIQDFQGKFVLLDFWTYCCINCMHAIHNLKELEEKYPELVVVGVHSAKFHNERAKENIRQAVLRYGIEHPVIVDNDFCIWRTYGIDAWPSFVLIGPDGQVIGKASGEGIFDRLDAVLGVLGGIYDEAGLLNMGRLNFSLEKVQEPETFLKFPGKIESDSSQARLFISDSNHNRIVAVNAEGEVIWIIGSGAQGQKDGNFKEAEFFRPQGMAFDAERNRLFVADTENHLIRMVELNSGVVRTVLGSGEKGDPIAPVGSFAGREVSLNSPWDLMVHKNSLFIAMAGSHQIWEMDLSSLQARLYAGTGEEGLVDGPVAMAAMAQPSGLTTDGQTIYVADSEASALRMINDGQVTTLIGKGLFEFGDRDGPFDQARLQHPIGLEWHDGSVYLADTYSHKIKRADISSSEIITIVGCDINGRRNGDALHASLNEPNDVAYLHGMFYIADTNNHVIRVYDPESGNISNLDLAEVKEEGRFARKRLTLRERQISPNGQGINLELMLPEGYHWNPDAGQKLEIVSKNPDVIAVLPALKREGFSYFIPVKVMTQAVAEKAELKIDAWAYFCDQSRLCYLEPVELLLPLIVTGSGNEVVEVSHQIEHKT
jgi:thiol-disulfide isomerase/thioredoxin